jgi:hypothetical protein
MAAKEPEFVNVRWPGNDSKIPGLLKRLQIWALYRINTLVYIINDFKIPGTVRYKASVYNYTKSFCL